MLALAPTDGAGCACGVSTCGLSMSLSLWLPSLLVGCSGYSSSAALVAIIGVSCFRSLHAFRARLFFFPAFRFLGFDCTGCLVASCLLIAPGHLSSSVAGGEPSLDPKWVVDGLFTLFEISISDFSTSPSILAVELSELSESDCITCGHRRTVCMSPQFVGPAPLLSCPVSSLVCVPP